MIYAKNVIKCKYCHTKTRIFNDFIRMRCMCNEDIRFYKLSEFLLGKHLDDLYEESEKPCLI